MLSTILSTFTPYFHFNSENLSTHASQTLFSYINKYQKILTLFKTSSDNFETSKYHQENLEEHFVACGIACQLYAEKFFDNISAHVTIQKDDFIQLSLLLGLFHDIGKPFSATKVSQKKTKVIYTGHSQLGARIMEELVETLDATQKKALLWAINHHMCHCTHCHVTDFSAQHHCYDQLFSDLDLNDNETKNLSIALLSVIAFGDMVSRADTTRQMDFEEINTYSIALFNKLVSYKPVIKTSYLTIVHMLGVSGSGKSHFSNKLKQKFGDLYDVAIVERDNALRNVYESLNLNTSANIPYHEMYSQIYQREDGKQLVQSRWVEELNFALTTDNGKQRIIVIDTCQTLFSKAWENTMSALEEDAKANYFSAKKICFYTVPWHVFNNEYSTKTQTYANLPLDFGGFWPILQHERENLDSCYEYGTGSFESLSTHIANNIQTNTIINTEYTQKRLDQILNEFAKSHTNFTECCDAFVKSMKSSDVEFVAWRIEQESQRYKLIVFTYQDGLQQFNLETRDYRGEGVIYDTIQNVFFLVRPNLPVFPEMTQIANDHKALPYLVHDVSKIANIQARAISLCKSIAPKNTTQICQVPKYDGSLFNLTFIPSHIEEYNILLDICNSASLPPNSYYKSENGLFMIGSKGTCFCKAPVNIRIHKAIVGSYGTFENFIVKAKQILTAENKNFEKSITTLHFEALDVTPTPELTVYYGYSACPLFGVTIYDKIADTKLFHLPNIADETILVAPIKKFDAFSEVISSYDTSYAELLNGNSIIEPEGFVIHLFDNEKWIPIKYKYSLYYVAHKPDSIKNQDKAKDMMTNPIYEKILPRLLKFRDKPSVNSIIESFDFQNQILSCLEKFSGQTKKDWAIFWKNEQNLTEIQTLLSQLWMYPLL
jgi:CRISPR/Cas system-associated endonuclease Cas3-HD